VILYHICAIALHMYSIMLLSNYSSSPQPMKHSGTVHRIQARRSSKSGRIQGDATRASQFGKMKAFPTGRAFTALGCLRDIPEGPLFRGSWGMEQHNFRCKKLRAFLTRQWFRVTLDVIYKYCGCTRSTRVCMYVVDECQRRRNRLPEASAPSLIFEWSSPVFISIGGS
jgi:hypothetical protein